MISFLLSPMINLRILDLSYMLTLDSEPPNQCKGRGEGRIVRY